MILAPRHQLPTRSDVARSGGLMMDIIILHHYDTSPYSEKVRLGLGLKGLAWVRRQFLLLGREADADALAMHLLARSQGVTTLASAFRDEAFIRQEVDQMCAWLDTCVERATRHPE